MWGMVWGVCLEKRLGHTWGQLEGGCSEPMGSGRVVLLALEAELEEREPWWWEQA